MTAPSASAVEHELIQSARSLRAGDWPAAQAICRRILGAYPRLPEAHYNLALACRGAGQLDAAIAAYRSAIACRPNFAFAQNNLGNALKSCGDLDESIACFRRAVEIDPNFAAAWNNLGAAHKTRGELDEALECIDRARALDPGNPELHSNRIYCMYFHPGITPAEIAREQELWNEHFSPPSPACENPRLAETRRGAGSAAATKRAPLRVAAKRGLHKLRIGYVSAYFREHCQANFLLPLLANHDRENFEIVCYSDTVPSDAITAKLRGHADRWRDTHRLSHTQLAETIRQDRIDILVDLTQHLAHNRLPVFAAKPAPVQISWLGYPAGAGLPAIDFHLTDPYLDPPESNPIGPEQPLHLPDTFWCYDPLTDSPPVNDLPALAGQPITFGCLNNFCKVNDAVLRLWAEAMQAVPQSRLLLLCPQGEARRRVRRVMGESGIAADRIEFSPFQPRPRYLQIYHRIDIGLDTFPYNGHTTSLDSFWMGVPVITLIGNSPVGRAGWCQLNNLGMSDWAAATPRQFTEVAAARAGDLYELRALRRRLRRRMQESPLMDAPSFARSLEVAFREAIIQF